MKIIENNTIQNQIKICHVIIQLDPPGGAERMLMQMLLNNPSSIQNKMVIVLCEAGPWGEQLSSAGVRIEALKMKSALDMPKAFFRIKTLLREFNPNIVQTWMYHSDFLGGLAAYTSGFKNIIWGIHRTSLSWNDSKITLILMKLCALMSSWLPKKIIPVAQAAKIHHIAAGYEPSRMEVIPNGFDFAKLTATQKQREEFRKSCGFSEDEIIIGCLGRFHPVKGQDNFVKAAALVLKANPEAKIKFLMVGDECDQKNTELMGWVNQYALNDSIVLLGNRTDVPICLSGMDIFCMPSRTECFPLCLGEAMAMGLPCVATDVGDTGFLSGGTTILVPPQDEEALAKGLFKVAALAKPKRIEMGEKAKIRVLSEFAIEKANDRYDAVYREIMTGSTC